MPRLQPLTLLALLESARVNGPAKNLIRFHRAARLLHARGEAAFALRTVVITFERERRDAPSELARACAAEGIEWVVVPERFRFDYRIAQAVGQLADRVGADIVESHSVKSHAVMRCSGAWRRRPWIAFHHGYTYTDGKMALYNQVDRWSLRAAHRVVTTARPFAALLARVGILAGRISVVHSAFDDEGDAPRGSDAPGLRQALRAELRVDDRELMVLSIGRLSREKGHADLVRAIAMVRRGRPHLPIVSFIAGDGTERDKLRRLADKLRVEDSVRFLGYVPNASRLYPAADIAALPSLSEGSPNALLEAAASALPIVATRVGGVPEIVADEESALLVPPASPRLLARGLCRLIDDSSLATRLGLAARATVAARHDPLTRAQSLFRLYAQVLHGI